MAEELQSLLEKINSEGVKKAEAERDAILAAAKIEADKIIADAKAQAEATRSRAEAEAEALKNRAESAIRQAARDIVLELKAELEARLRTAIENAGAAALTPEFMASLISELAAKFAASPDTEISVRSAVRDADALDAALRGALANSFKQQPKVLRDGAIRGGFEVSFGDGQLYFDFTEEALTELVGAYAGEGIARIFVENPDQHV